MADYKGEHNFEQWWEFIKDRVFLVRLYRRTGDWTPHELETRDPGQSHFEQGDKVFNACKIDHFVELPDGDILLALRYLSPDLSKTDDFVDYRRLSEVALVMPDDAETQVENLDGGNNNE